MVYLTRFILISLIFFVTPTEARNHLTPNSRKIDWYMEWTAATNKQQDSLIIPPAKPRAEENFLVTDTLTSEFIEKYRREFGAEETRGVTPHAPHETNFIEDEIGSNSLPRHLYESERMKSFGEYMVRRVTEYHADEALKRNPSTRPIHRAKERITKVDLQISEESWFRARHSWSGNYIEAWIENSLIELKVNWDLPFNNAGIGRIAEATYIAGKKFLNETSIVMYYKQLDGMATLIAQKPIRKKLSGSITVIGNTKAEGYSPRERAVIAGFTWTH